MKLSVILKTLAVKVSMKKNSLFYYPIDKQKRYLVHFNEPKDDIERSYFQYCCQMKLYGPVLFFFINIFSLPLFLSYLKVSRGTVICDSNSEAVFFSDGIPENIIPDGLWEKYSRIEIVKEKKEFFTKYDRAFVMKLLKHYPLSWHFLLKCLIKIRFYRYEIERVCPKSIIVCSEYSFTSSVLTKYCEELEIRHINVMHGEKLFFMRDSFFHFHECYVWDRHYVNLFMKLRAEKSQFIVKTPTSLLIKHNTFSKEIDYTYYLDEEGGENLRRIIKLLFVLQIRGFKTALRPHPRYSNLSEVLKCAENIEVENNSSLTIEESLCRTANAISVFSTVLYQASCNSIGVVFDDISNHLEYEKLKEMDYIVLNRPHQLLSSLVGEKESI